MTDLKPGRELDALIAEKVLGLTLLEEDCEGNWIPYDPEPYSTDIAAAWKVVEKMRNTRTAVSLVTVWDMSAKTFDWLCKIEFWGQDHFEFSSQRTAPLAICMASLAVVGYEQV